MSSESGRAGRGRQVGLALVAALAIVAGCDLLPRSGIFFPTDLSGSNVSPTARTAGTLTLEDGCLWLSQGDERLLLIWPPGYSPALRNDQVAVLDAAGTEVARVAERLAVGGGEMRAGPTPNADAYAEEITRQRVPAPCRLGRYWKIGGIL